MAKATKKKKQPTETPAIADLLRRVEELEKQVKTLEFDVATIRGQQQRGSVFYCPPCPPCPPYPSSYVNPRQLS